MGSCTWARSSRRRRYRSTGTSRVRVGPGSSICSPGAPRATYRTNAGVEAAIAKAKVAAGNKHVGVGPGSTVGQAILAGLIDELRVDLVPLTLGDGVRMLDGLTDAPRTFGTPQVIEGTGVTHLIYQLS